MTLDKRYYTRYPFKAECIVGFEQGVTFPAEILDLSAEGAKLQTFQEIELKIGDKIYLIIKTKYRAKLKAEVRWVSKKNNEVTFGIKFIDMTIKEIEVLSKLISEVALAGLSDIYL